MTIEINERREIARKLLAGASARVVGLVLVRALAASRIIVFARLFSPDDIGMATLAVACISMLASFADFGFFQSILRSREQSDRLANTAFSLSLISGGVMLGVALTGAPLVSRALSQDVTTYVRFLSFIVLAVPLQFPKVYFEKALRFGHPTMILVIPEVVSLGVAVAVEMTLHLGLWSLLIGLASGIVLAAFYIWIVAIRRPRPGIDRESVRPLLDFGTPFMLTAANGQAMARGDNLIVGALAGPTQLAYYNFAWQLPIIITSVAAAVDAMLLPVYARLNESRDQFIRLFNMANKTWSIAGSFLGFPLIVFAGEIVHILYGPTWKPVVPILQVMAASFILRFCTGYAYDNLVFVRGRTSYMMKWSFVNTALIFTVGVLMIRAYGPIGGAWFWVLQALIVNPFVRFGLIHQELGTLSYLRHVWQPLVAGLVAAALAWWLHGQAGWPGPVRLITSIAAYVTVYAGLFLALDRSFMVDIKRFVALARDQEAQIP